MRTAKEKSHSKRAFAVIPRGMYYEVQMTGPGEEPGTEVRYTFYKCRRAEISAVKNGAYSVTFEVLKDKRRLKTRMK